MTSPAPVTPSSDLHMQVEAMRWWHIQAAAQLDRTLFEHTAWSEAQFWSELARSNRHYVVLATSTGHVQPVPSLRESHIPTLGSPSRMPPNQAATSPLPVSAMVEA